MDALTKDELQFLIDIITAINVPVKSPDAGHIVAQSQSCINKLSKMIDALPQEKVEKPAT